MNQKFNNLKIFILWHDMLGEFGFPIIRRIIKHSQGHQLKNKNILFPNKRNTHVLLVGFMDYYFNEIMFPPLKEEK